MRISLFKNSYADKPDKTLTFDQFIKLLKTEWKNKITNLRSIKNPVMLKKVKAALPAVTISGEFSSRNNKLKIKDKLIEPSGLICLDADKKDNPKLRVTDIVDKDCIAQTVSCRGEGVKVVYKCEPTTDPKVHRRIFDAAVERLQKKGINIKIDPIVKSIASLQYVSYDPDVYYNPKTKLVIKPLPPKPTKNVKPSENQLKEIEQLNEYISKLGNIDVTEDYDKWVSIAFGLSYSLRESGREIFHKLSCNYPKYSEDECNEFYDACLEREVDDPVTLATVYLILNEHIAAPTIKQLNKKFNKTHAVKKIEATETSTAVDTISEADLNGYACYKLFLFKKVYKDSESKRTKEGTPKKELVDLIISKLNLNAFEVLLKENNFYRYGKKVFVHIVDNIVEEVDLHDIVRIVTKIIEDQGNYSFEYKGTEYFFPVEEIAHTWRGLRGNQNIFNQIQASLTYWYGDNLLKDTEKESYVPYQNGVVVVNATSIKLRPYSDITQQIWKDRILPRDFNLSKTTGMFGEFFANVCGRGADLKERLKSENYTRARWQFGYMLHNIKRQSNSRAWMLYDIKTGNNGRSGKTIIGKAVGHIRSMVTIDGKQLDLSNRFAFEKIMPYTEVVFIDDTTKTLSIDPIFNKISGSFDVDKKNLTPLHDVSVKFMFASNYILEAGGSSEKDRQYICQVSDFYVRYGVENNNSITPIVDYHGKEFYTDWNEKEWNEFDTFCLLCLQFYLAGERPTNEIIGSSEILRFIQNFGEELFFELAITLANNITKATKDDSLLIQQKILTDIVSDNNSDIKANRAGKIVRQHFLNAIGARNTEITTININGHVRMAYKIKHKWSDLDFASFSENVPKPKFLQIIEKISKNGHVLGQKTTTKKRAKTP